MCMHAKFCNNYVSKLTLVDHGPIAAAMSATYGLLTFQAMN